MNVEDLADALADQHGVTPGEMEGYLLEQVDRVIASHMNVVDMFDVGDIAVIDLTGRGERALREAIAEQFA